MNPLRHRATALATALLGLAAGLTALAPSPAVAAEVYTRPANGVFDLQGRGWGHGHGMSQWGALGGARLGVNPDAMLSAYYPGTASGSMGNPPIRVWITRDEGVDLHVLAAPGLRVADLSRPTGRMVLPAGPTHWRALNDGTGLHLQYYSASRVWTTYPLAGATTMAGPIVFYGPPVVRVMFMDGSSVSYRSSVQARRVGGSLYSLAVMPMDSYLYGVVPRESPASWDAGALQVQAVAARSYAAFEMRANAGAPYDICDTTACQVFGGSTYYAPDGSATQLEVASTNAAVNGTSGKVRTWGGAPIFAQFSSSNGGYSTAGSMPYLVAKPDPWDGVVPNSAHAWTTGLPASALEARYPSIGRLLRIVVLARENHGEWGGRVLSARLEGTAGSVNVTGSDVYYACPYGACSYGGLKSSWWRGQPSYGPASAPQAVRALGQDQKAYVTWATPASDGGTPVTSYTVSAAQARVSVTVPASARSTTLYGLPSGTAQTISVVANNAGGRSAAGSSTVTPTWVVGDYFPVAPVRVLDTRRSGGPLVLNETRAVRVTGVAGVPASGVNAVLVNVTVVSPSRTGYLTVYAAGEPRPRTVTTTFAAGRTVAAGGPVRVGVGPGGYLNVYNYTGTTHVLVDVVGYVDAHLGTPGASQYVARTPVRALDTRTSGGPLAAGATREVDLSAIAPAGARAAVVNLTGVSPAAGTYLTAYQSGTAPPAVSSLNLGAGETRANLAIVPLSASRRFTIYNRFGAVNAVVDVQGFFVPGGASRGRFAATLPTRLLDSRLSGGPLAGGVPRRIRVAGTPGVPGSVSAAVVALTGFAASRPTYLTGWSGSGAQPLVSTVNLPVNGYVSNLAVIPVAPDGTIAVTNAVGSSQVTVDLVGFLTP